MFALPSRPEDQLLVCIARRYLDDVIAHRIKELLSRNTVDWQYVFAAAAAHGVSGLLTQHLLAIDGGLVPTEVRRQLQLDNQRNTERSLALAGELIKVVGALSAQDVSSIPFKGPTLALMAYDDLGLRQFADLDILIHERDFSIAKQTLADCGFAPITDLDRGREAALLRFDSACGFRNDHDVFLDVHWRFASAYSGLRLETMGMWKRLQQVRIGNHTLSTLSTEDLLLVLSCHGFTHLWERLAWICDIAGLVETRKNLDWEAATQRAADCGVQRILLLGLLLAHEMLGAELPTNIVKFARRDAFVRKHVERLQGSLFLERSAKGMLENAALQIGMRERTRDKVGSLFNLVATPRNYDWMFASVPRSLGFLYYFIRPVRMARAYGSRLMNARSA